MGIDASHRIASCYRPAVAFIRCGNLLGRSGQGCCVVWRSRDERCHDLRREGEGPEGKEKDARLYASRNGATVPSREGAAGQRELSGSLCARSTVPRLHAAPNRVWGRVARRLVLLCWWCLPRCDEKEAKRANPWVCIAREQVKWLTDRPTAGREGKFV